MKKIPSYIRIVLVFLILWGVVEYVIDSGDQMAVVKFPMVALFMVVILLFLVVIEVMIKYFSNLNEALGYKEQKGVKEEAGWYKSLMEALTKSKPIEAEKDVLLDHNYDGIKELDNTLPPWWVYLFYITIAFAAIYLVATTFFGAYNQEVELSREMAQAKIAIEEYKKTAPDLVDETNVTQLTDAASLEAGKTIFMAQCAVCHRPDAGGQIGPNLTDNQWIFGGKISDLFHTVVNGGREGKGMVSWKAILKPKEIQEVTSYILSLQGTNPKDPKAPEGEVFVAEVK